MDTERLILELLRRISTPREALLIWLFLGFVLFSVMVYNQRYTQR